MDRRRFGRVLWLFGDSIFQGLALGKFADAMTAEQASRNPLWPFRSPAAMINLFLSDTDSLRFGTTGEPIEGDCVAAFGGQTKFPHLARESVTNVQGAIKSGLIQPSDNLVFLDAGHHFGNPDWHEAAWGAIVRAAATSGARAFFCTVFDNLAEHESPSVGRTPKEVCMHDINWNGGRTHNDALRTAVAEEGKLGLTQLLDTSPILDEWHRRLLSEYGVSSLLPDKIHPNVWGQMRLSWVLFAAAWPDLARQTVPRSTEILSRATWERLGYRTTHSGWNGNTAVEVVRICTFSGV